MVGLSHRPMANVSLTLPRGQPAARWWSTREGIWRLEFDPPVDATSPVEAQVDLAGARAPDQVQRRHGSDVWPGAGQGPGRPHLDSMLSPHANPAAQACVASIIEAGYRVSNLESSRA